MKFLLKKQEFYISCLLLLIVITISTVNPSFLNLGNIFSLLKSSIVLGILALGVLLVLITGGIDVSFPVVAGFSLYTGAMIFAKFYPSTPLILVFIYAMAVGSFCGFLNGFLIAHFKFPALVVTLGSSSAISGFMYTFIGTRPIKKLPDSLVEFGKKMLFEQDTDTGFIGLPTAIVILIALCLIVYFMLRYTMFGRYIFALGGDEISAERAGINTQLVKILVYVIVGALAGVAGVIRISFLRIAHPFELYGSELSVIAATVLGGAYIGGGKGTVYGTITGILLIIVINNSLILLGIPSYWQQFVIGAILLCSVSIPVFLDNLTRENV